MAAPLVMRGRYVALVATFTSAYLIHRRRHDVAFAALLPLLLISAVPIIFAMRGVTLLPMDDS